MCGIVGVISNSCNNIIVEALRNLEYRGYDSVGVMIYDDLVHIKKRVGGVENILPIEFNGNIGIGHTRWATTGIVSEENAHPHFTTKKRFYIVHNGIIKNYKEIKEKYFKEDTFTSNTDSEIIAHLLEYFSESNNVLDSIKLTINELVGSYAVIIFDTLNPTFLFSFSNNMPLFLGVEKRIISSDLLGLIDCNKFINIEGKIVLLADKYYIYDNLLMPTKYFIYEGIKRSEISKNGYEHFMIKEIHDSSNLIINLYNSYNNLDFKLEDMNIIGCGSSYFASQIGEYLLSDLIDCKAYIGSEFKYRHKKRYALLLTQSGETKDIKDIIPLLDEYAVLTNNIYSSIALMSKSYNLYAGVEVSVASTKCFLSMVLFFTIVKEKALNKDLSYLLDIKSEVDKILNMDIKNNILDKVIIIASGIDYYIACELALKLKETSYINAYALNTGELKHGSLAIVDENTTVISIVSNEIYKASAIQAIEESKSRGANIIRVFYDELGLDQKYSIIGIIVYIQLLSYYKALDLGVNVDRPKNLAKSVTVE